MFFRMCMCLKKIKSLQAVLGGKPFFLLHSNCSQNNAYGGRTSRCASFFRKGGLTLEAALVFPLFLFGVTALLYLFVLVQLQTEVDRALTDAARELSADAYFIHAEERLSASAGSAVYAKRRVEEYLKDKISADIIEGGEKGVSLLGSSWKPETSQLTLCASYRVILPPGIPGFHKAGITQEKVVRGWTGFGGRREGLGEKGEKIVYITDYGTVYHCRLDCRYLKVSVRQAGRQEAEALRNESGGKYYPCERCWKKGGDLVFLTEAGNRYHETLNCPGLSRSIHAAPISEAGGRPACAVCGE